MKKSLIDILILVSCLIFSHVVWAKDNTKMPESTVRYVEMKPSFVANYGGAGKLRYLRAEVSIRVKNPDSAGAVRYHSAAIRSAIVFMLSKASANELNSLEGREVLRGAILEEAKTIMKAEEPSAIIEDILFTSFIVQT